MMKNIFVLLIIVIFGPAVYAANGLDGIYYGEGGRIEICGNKFVFVKVIDNHDTKKLVTAVCFRENEHMFVIRQNKPDSMVRANAITEQSKVRMSDSNCRHVFVAFPDIENMELDISLTYRDDSVCGGSRQNDEFTTQKYIYSNMTDRNCGYMKIPMNVRTVMLSVCPRKRQPSIEIPSEYYNGYYAYTMPVNIDEESNIIKITIPYIDDGYFGRYYVNGDYIRVDGDKLHWRGRVFKKSTVPESR